MLAAEAARLTAPEAVRRSRLDGAGGAGAPARAGARRRRLPADRAPRRDRRPAHASRWSATRARSTGSAPGASTRRACSARSSTRDNGGQLLDPARRASSSRPSSSTCPGTAVLVTRFFTESGVGEVVDFMPLGPGELLDRAPRRGRARLAALPASRCAPAFDYARAPHRLVDRRTGWPRSSRGRQDVRAALVRDRASRPTAGAAVAEFTLGARRARLVRALGRARPGPAWDGDAVERRVPGDGRVLARVDRARAAIAAAGARSSTAPRSRSSCSPTCRPARSSRRRRRACPSTSAGRATGTTATAGCATRRSRCSRSCASASATRRSATCSWLHERGNVRRGRRAAAGHVRHRRPQRPDRARAPAPRRLSRLGAGAHRQRRVDPAPARRLRRGRRRGLPGRARRHAALLRRSGSSCARSSTGWPTTGISPTRASGRCAAAGATSPTRGS